MLSLCSGRGPQASPDQVAPSLNSFNPVCPAKVKMSLLSGKLTRLFAARRRPQITRERADWRVTEFANFGIDGGCKPEGLGAVTFLIFHRARTTLATLISSLRKEMNWIVASAYPAIIVELRDAGTSIYHPRKVP